MKKRLYDFSVSTGVIVLSAYIFIYVLTIFNMLKDESVSIFPIVILILLSSSLIALLVFYVFMPIIVNDEGVKHRKKFILKENVEIYLRPNYRTKYNEIVFRDKTIDYKALDPKEEKESEIILQFSSKYEKFVLEFFKISELNYWSE